jgi:hypothetical protein
LVEPAQVRDGDVHRGQHGGQLDGCVGDVRRPRSLLVAKAVDAEDDGVGRRGFPSGRVEEGAFDTFLGMVVQQEQHADELPGTGERPVADLQGASQLGEGRGQHPVAIDRGVIQARRLARERCQVMEGIEHHRAAFVRARMSRDDLPGGRDGDLIDVRLDRHRLKRVDPRHAVGHVVEPDGLVFVDLGGHGEAGIEGPRGQGDGRGAVALEAVGDGIRLAGGGAVLIVEATSPEMLVQLGEIANTRHRRRPSSFQVLDSVLDVRLLVAAGRHAEQGLEVVVAGQGLVALVEPPLAPFEHLHGHGGRVVPPEFLGDAAEGREGLDQAVEDGFGALGGQGDGEGAIRERPGDDQDRDKATAVGKIDVDMAEVGLGATSRVVVQGDERLAFAASQGADVASDLVVAALIPVLGNEPTMDPGRGVSLFARGLFIGREDLVDHGLEGIELGRGRRLGPGIGLGLGVLDRLADGASRVVEGPGDGPETHAVAERPSDTCVIVHREHP